MAEDVPAPASYYAAGKPRRNRVLPAEIEVVDKTTGNVCKVVDKKVIEEMMANMGQPPADQPQRSELTATAPAAPSGLHASPRAPPPPKWEWEDYTGRNWWNEDYKARW